MDIEDHVYLKEVPEIDVFIAEPLIMDGIDTAEGHHTQDNVESEQPSPALTATAATAALDTITVLYNSGVTHHMTPHKDILLNCHSITLKPINAVNQIPFWAIGYGDLPVQVPNGNAHSSTTLKDMLHASDLGLTLVSISPIDNAGFTTTFSKDACRIHNESNVTVGIIPKTDRLYKVDQKVNIHTALYTTPAKLTIIDAPNY